MAAVTCAANLTVTAARPASAGRGQNIAGSLAVTAARPGFVANKIIGASLEVTAVTDGGENVFPLEFPYVTDGTPALMHRDATASANLTVGVTPYVGDVDGDSALFHQCEQIWAATRRLQRKEEALRREQPLVRIYDAEWELQHLMSNDYKSTFSWISNDSGPGQSEIPYDSPLAAWIHDMQGRIDRGENRNVHIVVEYCGARWSGRLDKYSIEQRDDGDEVMVIDWLNDYENTKWIACWSNPFLPAFIQFPRVWLLPGPITWILKLTMFLNLFRHHNPLVTLPDDPMDPISWFENLDQSTWQMVVKPQSFLNAVASGVVWGLVSSRWKTWHDMAHTMLEDGELSVECRRYLPGDPPPWEGADLRYGTLVFDLIDKSGVFVGTSNGGSIFDGFLRTFVEFADDFVDSTDELAADADTPTDYFLPGLKLTKKEMPYVVFREGTNSPIQSSSYIVSPAKGVIVNTGGKSAPGVNEAISASIQAAGDILGSLVQIGSLGGTIDKLVEPIYKDTILAWSSWKSPERAQHSGWSRYEEYWQDGADKAYTIAQLMVTRAGFWATKTTVSWKVNVVDGLPFLIGDNGLGHFFLDDRIGLVLKGDSKIHMDRCRKLELAWDEDNPPEWQITIGDERVFQDPAQRAWGRVEQIVSALKDLGVY